MSKSNKNVTPIKTKAFFSKICKICYVCGAPNIWFDELNISKPIVRMCDRFWKFGRISFPIFVLMEWGAFFTQQNLTEKQAADRLIYSLGNLIQNLFFVHIIYYKDNIKKLLVNLVVDLKEVYNDAEVERDMIKKIKVVSISFFSIFCTTLFMYGIHGVMEVISKDGTFVTIILAWPDVEDRSILAGFGRVIAYIVWCTFTISLSHVYTILLTLIICTSHQYKNLQSYFHSLNDIFDDDNLNQIEKELEYEKALKVGFKLHSKTLRCTEQCQIISNGVQSGQIIINITLLTILMSQIVNSDHTLSGALVSATTILAVLISTAVLMLNAGDITVEAEQLPTAMYCSGWQHCARSAGRVRALIITAMVRAQEPVELQCLGVVKLSYSSFVSIVKMSYTIFSVLY